MPVINILKQTQVKTEPRLQMLSGMFDCPIEAVNEFSLNANIPIEEKDWQIGLIVGPSGCGKSSILNQIGKETLFEWDDKSIITSFSKEHEVTKICEVLNSVGFGNVRAWMRPYHVLSNGEKFRAYCARAIIESQDVICLDEFTSVVDRQVAKVACHAVQKYLRKTNKKLIAASCHDDIIDWLQPDWYYAPHTDSFEWRYLRRRPEIEIEIYETKHSTWKMFAPYHYLTASLHKSARCYLLLCNGRAASFVGVLHRPISAKGERLPIWGVSRVVTLPEFQGLGLAFVLMDSLGEMYLKQRKRFRMYPAHPALVRQFEKHPKWKRTQKYGMQRPHCMGTERVKWVGDRPCGIYEYTG